MVDGIKAQYNAADDLKKDEFERTMEKMKGMPLYGELKRALNLRDDYKMMAYFGKDPMAIRHAYSALERYAAENEIEGADGKLRKMEHSDYINNQDLVQDALGAQLNKDMYNIDAPNLGSTPMGIRQKLLYQARSQMIDPPALMGSGLGRAAAPAETAAPDAAAPDAAAPDAAAPDAAAPATATEPAATPPAATAPVARQPKPIEDIINQTPARQTEGTRPDISGVPARGAQQQKLRSGERVESPQARFYGVADEAPEPKAKSTVKLSPNRAEARTITVTTPQMKQYYPKINIGDKYVAMDGKWYQEKDGRYTEVDEKRSSFLSSKYKDDILFSEGSFKDRQKFMEGIRAPRPGFREIQTEQMKSTFAPPTSDTPVSKPEKKGTREELPNWYSLPTSPRD